MNQRQSRCKLFKMLMIAVAAVCIIGCVFLMNEDKTSQVRKIQMFKSPRTAAGDDNSPGDDVSSDVKSDEPAISAKVSALRSLHIEDGSTTFKRMPVEIWSIVQEFHAPDELWFLTELQMDIMEAVKHAVENRIKTNQCDEVCVDFKDALMDGTEVITIYCRPHIRSEDRFQRITGQITQGEIHCLNQTIYHHYGRKISIQWHPISNMTYKFDGKHVSYLTGHIDYCQAQKKVVRAPVISRSDDHEEAVEDDHPQSQSASFAQGSDKQAEAQCRCVLQ